MKKIWDEENKFKIWFEIEAHAADGMASNGTIPKEAAKKIWEKGKFEIVCGAPNIEKGQKVPVATIGSVIYTNSGEKIKISKSKIRGVVSNGMVCAEPKIALDGGLDGLDVIRKVISKSKYLLKINGKLILEIGYDQKYKVTKFLKEKNFYINKIIKDYGNNIRCIVSTKIN